jgi:hypothetical protein
MIRLLSAAGNDRYLSSQQFGSAIPRFVTNDNDWNCAENMHFMRMAYTRSTAKVELRRVCAAAGR